MSLRRTWIILWSHPVRFFRLILLNGLINNSIHSFSAAFDLHLSLAILRAPEGLDFSGLIAESTISPLPSNNSAGSPQPTDAVPSVSLDTTGVTLSPATLKPSASTASGWSDRKTISRSQDSLQSHGNYGFIWLIVKKKRKRDQSNFMK